MAAFAAAVGNSDQPFSDYYTAQDRERAEAAAGPLMIFAIIIIVISCFGLLEYRTWNSQVQASRIGHSIQHFHFHSRFHLHHLWRIHVGLAAAGGNLLKAAIEQGLK